MKDLVAASGVHRQTIHYYLREGVLPPASASAGTRNARYNSSHLELLRIIRQLREERGLSLKAIRQSFEEAGFEPEQIEHTLHLTPDLSSALDDVDVEPLVVTELLARSGASSELLEALVEDGLLPAEPGFTPRRFASEAIDVLEAAHVLEESGFKRGRVTRLSRLSAAVAQIEVGVFASKLTKMDASVDEMLNRAQEGFQRVTELLSAVRRFELARTLRSLAAVSPRSNNYGAEAIYKPSALFLRRYGFDEALSHAEKYAFEHPRDATASLAVGRILITIGRFEEAINWLEGTLRIDPKSVSGLAYLGTARALCGHERSGLVDTRHAVALHPNSARAHVFHSAVLGLCAAATTGLTNASALLDEAFTSSIATLQMPVSDPREEIEVLLTCGRTLSILPRDSDGFALGLDALERAVAATREPTERVEGEPDWNAYFRMSALFFLGILCVSEDPPRAVELFQQCIVIDPLCRFAEQAYLLLAEL